VPLTDEQLLQSYRDGDLAAFRELMERYHDDLLRFLTRMVGERAGAEDVFQETFLQIHNASGTFDMTRKFRPWLFTIAANKARDYLRRKNRRKAFDLSAPVSGGSNEGGQTEYVDLLEVRIPAPGDPLDAKEQSEQVQRVLETLSPTLREVLLLSYFQRLSYAQIAEDLQIPLGTVKSRLHAAVATFAKRWSESEGKEMNGTNRA
jgi:RNA polymerase sigma-70 factor, ECF subfamily